jgi:hypothetical protein
MSSDGGSKFERAETYSRYAAAVAASYAKADAAAARERARHPLRHRPRAVVPARALEAAEVMVDAALRRESVALDAAPHGVAWTAYDEHAWLHTTVVLAPVGGGEWAAVVVREHSCTDERCCHRTERWAHGRYGARVLRLACDRAAITLSRADMAACKVAAAAALPLDVRRGAKWSPPTRAGRAAAAARTQTAEPRSCTRSAT